MIKNIVDYEIIFVDELDNTFHVIEKHLTYIKK